MVGEGVGHAGLVPSANALARFGGYTKRIGFAPTRGPDL